MKVSRISSFHRVESASRNARRMVHLLQGLRRFPSFSLLIFRSPQLSTSARYEVAPKTGNVSASSDHPEINFHKSIATKCGKDSTLTWTPPLLFLAVWLCIRPRKNSGLRPSFNYITNNSCTHIILSVNCIHAVSVLVSVLVHTTKKNICTHYKQGHALNNGQDILIY